MLSKKSQLKNNSQNKNEKGITLVALVITVVVMLILAGVAIAAVVNGDGLFSRARESAQIYENATREEGDTIQSMINQIDGYIDEINNPNNPVVKDIAAIGTIVTENQTYDGRLKGTYSNPIIPKGFAPINENGAIWGTDDGYQKGLVIEDENENQFVWVPVDGTNVTFERQDWRNSEGVLLTYPEDTTIGVDTDTQYTETVPEAIITSVNNNGGFYIGRYEAGLPNGEISSSVAKDGSVKPISKQGATVWNSITWSDNGTNDEINLENGAVIVAKSMYPVENENYGVASTLIYGVQWDTALKFIGVYNGDTTYAIDSIGKGNYSGTSGGDTTTEQPATCGLLDAFGQKNIYDMAGNVWEWTMEKYSTYRVIRGGSYGNSGSAGPASLRYNNGADDENSYGRFPCCTLYKVDLNTEGHRIN